MHFSIIVPTHNRHASLERCLNALACLNYARSDFEIILVDDGSRTPVGRPAIQSGDDLQIRIIRQENGGAASARNSGSGQARGKYLAFTDDDCEPHSDWLLHLAESLNKSPHSAVTGRTLNLLEDNVYASAAQLLIDYLYAYYNARPQHSRFLTSNNFALPADAFHALGGFRTEFLSAGGEDRELCDRWLSKGLPVVYSPEAIVFHSHSMTLKGYLRQQYNYGKGAFHYNRLRSTRNGRRFSVEPLRFYIGMFQYPYRKQRLLRAILFDLLFAASQGMNLAGFAFETTAYRLRSRS